MSAVDIVQRQLDAYNAQDIDAFCACFCEDCVLADLNGAVTEQGIVELRTRYAHVFERYASNEARLVNRIAVGNVVIDHEDIARSPTQRFEAIAVYTVRDGLIARVDFARAP